MSGIGRLILTQPDCVSDEDVADVLDVIVQRLELYACPAWTRRGRSPLLMGT